MKYLGVFILLLVGLSSLKGYPQSGLQISSSSNPAEGPGDDSDMYLEPEHEESRNQPEEYHPDASQQSFYPSFSPFQNPPLGHSRPFVYNQPETAYSQRPQSGYQQQQVAYDTPRYSGYKDDGYRAQANADSHGLLGSGNFGVIRGGTFYDKDTAESSSNYDRDYSSFFRNGHGRPSFYFGGVPNPRPYQHEQFENFRDFADINTPSNPAYSQYVVVYVNKNGTKHNDENLQQSNEEKEEEFVRLARPKNIIESLALLDLESSNGASTTTEIPQKKMSKSKAKLAKVLPEKKRKLKNKTEKSVSSQNKGISRDTHEPLLALS